MGGVPGAIAALWNTDDVIVLLSVFAFFPLGLFLLLLGAKFVLGMPLLCFSRNRYRSRKVHEREVMDAKVKRFTGFVCGCKRGEEEMVYKGDPEELNVLREREKVIREKERRIGAKR
jgi:hypothetical protein